MFNSADPSSIIEITVISHTPTQPKIDAVYTGLTEGENRPSFEIYPATELPTPVTQYFSDALSSWWKKKGIARVLSDALQSLTLIVLHTLVVFVYAMCGAAVLLALDAASYAEVNNAITADFQGQHFNDTQLAYLATNGIPAVRANYTLLEMYFYASTLITSIGYGTITSYSIGARWFATLYSAIGIVLVGFLTLRLREYMFRLFMSVLMLLGTLVLPVRFGPGRGILLADMVPPIFDELDHDGSGILNVWAIRELLLRVHSALDDKGGVPVDLPTWDTVCTIVIKACRVSTGTLSRAQLAKAMNIYALFLAEEKEKRQSSVLIFKISILLVWVFSGALVYANFCPCMGNDLGVAIYFIVVTLATIGTGDVCPCTTRCYLFWFFHTILGLGIMAAVVEVCAIHLHRLLRVALDQRMEISPHYSHQFEWGPLRLVAARFRNVIRFCKAVCIIMAYTFFGGLVFSGFEAREQAAAWATFNQAAAQCGFTASQAAYLVPHFKLDADWSILGGSRFAFEALSTLGYGALAPKSSGGRTFLIFYVIFGLGLVGFQLGRLAEVVRLTAQLIWDGLAYFLPWTVTGTHHDQRLLRMITSALEAFEGVARQSRVVPVEELRGLLADAGDARDVAELMAFVSCSAKGQDISVRELSVNLARLYNDLRVRTWRRDLAAAWMIMAILFLVSIPVFATLEQWSVGNASWFMYITVSGIGLGDLVVTTTPAVAYWFFFVFITIGTQYIFVCSVFVVFGDLHRRIMGWLADRWGLSDGAATVINRDVESDVTSSLYSVGLPEDHTFTVTSFLQCGLSGDPPAELPNSSTSLPQASPPEPEPAT